MGWADPPIVWSSVNLNVLVTVYGRNAVATIKWAEPVATGTPTEGTFVHFSRREAGEWSLSPQTSFRASWVSEKQTHMRAFVWALCEFSGAAVGKAL